MENSALKVKSRRRVQKTALGSSKTWAHFPLNLYVTASSSGLQPVGDLILTEKADSPSTY